MWHGVREPHSDYHLSTPITTMPVSLWVFADLLEVSLTTHVLCAARIWGDHFIDGFWYASTIYSVKFAEFRVTLNEIGLLFAKLWPLFRHHTFSDVVPVSSVYNTCPIVPFERLLYVPVSYSRRWTTKQNQRFSLCVVIPSFLAFWELWWCNFLA